MKKLILEVDALRVETFETATPPAETGTVHGHTGALTDCGTLLTVCNGGATCGGQTCDTCPPQGCLHTVNEICANQTGSLSVCGCASAQCTGNGGELACWNSLDFCLETQPDTCGGLC